MSLQADIDHAVRTLYKFGDVVAKNRQRIAALGGAYMAASIEAGTPRSSKPHHRYSTAKVTKGLRAPKGMGNKVATYYPGNLAGSIQTLRFRRAKTKVYVGARLAKGNPKGVFGAGLRVDGYYLAMLERKRPFFRAAVDRGTPRTLSVMLQEWTRLANQFTRQNAAQ